MYVDITAERAKAQPLTEHIKGAEVMKLTYSTRKVALKQSMKQRAEQKLSKLTRFFGDAYEGHVVFFRADGGEDGCEITIRYGGMIFRANQTGPNMYAAIDSATDHLIRQIRKNKTRLEKRLKAGAFDLLEAENGAAEPERDYRVIKTKTFSVKPMDVDEAILQMELLAHSFFVFRDTETDEINVIYRRNDGGYGLIIPETG